MVPRPRRAATTASIRRHLRGSVLIAAGMAVMNLGTYGFTIAAARLLGPDEYGALAAVMGLLLVVTVVALGLQAVGARRVSTDPGRIAAISPDVLRSTYGAAAALGLVLVLCAPLVAMLLSLDSVLTAALVGVTTVPITVMGGQAGLVQGHRSWGWLAGVYLAVGVGRIGCGLLALVLSPTSLSAMVGVSLGAMLPVLVSSRALHRLGVSVLTPIRTAVLPPTGAGGRDVLRELGGSSHALLAFFALSNADVLVARTVLEPRTAGLYAGGLILTKAVLFLPQFVVVVAFPSMTGAESARRENLVALSVVLAIGGSTVAGVAALPELAVLFVGGPAYAALAPRLWLFAGLGTLLALLQILVYNLLARRLRRRILLIWAALIVLLASGAVVQTLPQLLLTVLAVDLVLFVVLGLRAGRRGRERLT